ncbi:hypothetical protein LHK_02257 [Laribacter hongkongensis HLHK9]|uniref:Uncharacterized protein n=1 Tax=Laribacter hongkongensis (strain HLHK9) TaxID=557598 RepID=C1DAC6_LARHH|nr:hypothetical protein LHK_02257 [Laribacter hongkongensis HLHK9]
MFAPVSAARTFCPADDKDKYGKPVSGQNLTVVASGKLHNILCFTVMKIIHIDRA